ncbi:hypothetical protein ACFOSC_16855 [Streptantibioticus rubrisoli]|uniref:Uncharacterized protein n=1 Tax=Streptantibioticus rubrisoli TaxID=1387313 RepID=A0ABT1PGV6_9ACTN|nr:hypothetical protein [Streptantibioticus rubrisoli]MCQ4044603.1 hypothetical protein [Streptantibioticus rubrisoli]
MDDEKLLDRVQQNTGPDMSATKKDTTNFRKLDRKNRAAMMPGPASNPLRRA